MACFVSIFCIARRRQLDIAFAARAATIRHGRERLHRVTPSRSTAERARQPGRKFQDITIQLCGKWAFLVQFIWECDPFRQPQMYANYHILIRIH